jgi:hypothetical protein
MRIQACDYIRIWGPDDAWDPYNVAGIQDVTFPCSPLLLSYRTIYLINSDKFLLSLRVLTQCKGHLFTWPNAPYSFIHQWPYSPLLGHDRFFFSVS